LRSKGSQKILVLINLAIAIADGILTDGYAADDGVGLHFINGTLSKIVSSCPSAKAYRVEQKDTGVQETVLELTYPGN
jgi:dipeptidase E